MGLGANGQEVWGGGGGRPYGPNQLVDCQQLAYPPYPLCQQLSTHVFLLGLRLLTGLAPGRRVVMTTICLHC